MAVPTSGNFDMFGSGTTTIAGAIVEGGGSVSGLTTFSQLIAAATVSKFDATYAGTINSLSDITSSLQFRNYPATDCNFSTGTAAYGAAATPTPTPTPTLTPTPTPSSAGATTYNYYIAARRLVSATSTSYFTSPGYNMSKRLITTEQSLDSLGGDLLIDPDTGVGYVGSSANVDLETTDTWIYAISTTNNLNTLSVAYNDRFVSINSSGYILDVGNMRQNNTVEVF